jgi:hypothetical protein
VFDKLSYKRRNYLLLLGTVFFLLIALLFPIRASYDYYNENNVLRNRLSNVEKVPQQIASLKKTLNNYNKKMQLLSGDRTGKEDYLLQQLANACKLYGVSLTSLTPPQSYQENDYLIETRKARLKGNFISLLNAIYKMERITPVGRITSVQFYVDNDFKTSSKHLYAYIYIQNINSASK